VVGGLKPFPVPWGDSVSHWLLSRLGGAGRRTKSAQCVRRASSPVVEHAIARAVGLSPAWRSARSEGAAKREWRLPAPPRGGGGGDTSSPCGGARGLPPAIAVLHRVGEENALSPPPVAGGGAWCPWSRFPLGRAATQADDYPGSSPSLGLCRLISG